MKALVAHQRSASKKAKEGCVMSEIISKSLARSYEVISEKAEEGYVT